MEFAFEEVLRDEPPFRLKQVKKALFIDLIGNWQEATILPFVLREKLNKHYPLEIKGEVLFSKDERTAKAVIVLKDRVSIETVLMRHKDKRNTVCVSSQVGCPLGCVFCRTGKAGFKRSLEAEEIVEQVLFFARILNKEKEKVSNIVFMGMGEPFLNYDRVLEAIRILNDKDGFGIGARHISISTVGIIEGIEKLAKENLQVNLAISLHASNNNLRSKIMPANEKFPIEKIIEAVDGYIKQTNRRVMFEYLMIKEVNDSDDCAKSLAVLMKKPLYFVNLIAYNPTGEFEPSSGQRIKRFKEILEKEGVLVTQRFRFGKEIKAACGQLTASD